jgi:DTW domain-containing protein
VKIDEYRKRREEYFQQFNSHRESCFSCFQPSFGCYCEHVKRFDPEMKFVILIHPIERRRRIATGRMTHLCLENSDLIIGEDYSKNAKVNSILSDSNYHSVMLYPGVGSTDISLMPANERSTIFPEGKKLAVFVIDGTWNTARKMVRSENLRSLQRICFTPSAPSTFRVRKQPKEGCVSTIEAVHETIELVGSGFGFDVASRRHDNLLFVFDQLVENQLKFITEVKTSRHTAAKVARLAKAANGKRSA